MQAENTNIEYKSLKKVIGKKADLKALAETCVCLANAQGGTIYIGIEDKDKQPPLEQTINQEIVNDTLSRLRSLTDSVGFAEAIIEQHPNGSDYFHFKVLPSSRTIATTTSGKIFLRVQDNCYPVTGEEITRLAAEKNAFQWELVQIKSVHLDDIPLENIKSFTNDIRQSKRVKDSVKAKDDNEILEHYNLYINNILTNLGILWLGSANMRSRISYPITVQYIVYNEYDEKIRKENWHDYDLNPKELILSIEKQATELKYFYEFPQGLFRKRINQYAPEVVRELLINAIAHKKYTISEDIFIEIYPDRLEITNPGNLPIGISKNNILHQRYRRNPHLIRILHDLNLMEGEGSGYDLIYELDSKDNKPFPEIISEYDYTSIVQSSKVIDEDVVYLLEYISKHYNLSQKQFIALGIIAREKKLLGTELSNFLQLTEEERLRSYVGKLLENKILITRGERKGTQYLINPELIKASSLNIKPSLKTIEIHSLKALIEQDLKIHPDSKIGEIYSRIPDIAYKDLQKAIYELVNEGILNHTPDKTHRKYCLAKKNRE
jgi:ATP-dependent DNA helicase RecG